MILIDFLKNENKIGKTETIQIKLIKFKMKIQLINDKSVLKRQLTSPNGITPLNVNIA